MVGVSVGPEAKLWTRPGKDRGISATTNHAGSDLLYVFSSSTVFEADRSYEKFGAYALLNHAGDFQAAARALAQQGYGVPPAVAAAIGVAKSRSTVPVLVCMADVGPEDVSWIWPTRMARRKLNLIVGDPGLGKSTISVDMAARISRGAAWPDGGTAPLGDVVILTAEDGLADTVRPQLDLHGADVARVHVLRAVREATGLERGISLATDLGPLEQAIAETHAVLVVIDPISAYLGMANSYRDSEVRAILAPLHALAERTDVAICGVMHLTKDQQRSALYRGQGSIAFVGAARLVLAVGADPADATRERRFLMPVKANVCAAAATLAYQIMPVEGRGRLAWETAPVQGVDVNVVLGPQRPEEGEGRRDAEAFLREYLKDGPRSKRMSKKPPKRKTSRSGRCTGPKRRWECNRKRPDSRPARGIGGCLIATRPERVPRRLPPAPRQPRRLPSIRTWQSSTRHLQMAPIFRAPPRTLPRRQI